MGYSLGFSLVSLEAFVDPASIGCLSSGSKIEGVEDRYEGIFS